MVDRVPWTDANGCCSAHGKVRCLFIARRNGLLAGPGGNGDSYDYKVRDIYQEIASHNQDISVSSFAVDTLLKFLSAPTDQAARVMLPASMEASVVSRPARITPRSESALTAISESLDVAASLRAETLSASASSAGEWWASLGGDSVAAAEAVGRWGGRLSVRDLYALGPWELRAKVCLYCTQLHAHLPWQSHHVNCHLNKSCCDSDRNQSNFFFFRLKSFQLERTEFLETTLTPRIHIDICRQGLAEVMKETRMIEASKMMPFTNTKLRELNSGSAKPSRMMPPNLTPREVLMSVLAIEFMRR